MGDMQSVGSAIHSEEVKIENFLKTHMAATAIGAAAVTTLIVIAAVIFFNV